ncbi:MAG: cellulase family glycosylhydrolase [Bacteroidales bacterium]|nr:cellulase family glycosylhydrolase [Bacteroidales bacterium]
MKRILFMLSAIFMAMSCGPDDPQAEQAVKLSVDKTSLAFTAEGGEQTFTVTASEQLYLVPGDGWVSTRKGVKGADHKTVVTVIVQSNTVAQERQTRLSVVAGEEKIYVDISQEAGKGNSGSGGGNQGSGGNVPENDGNLAWQMAERLGIGWNMGNHFDAQNNGVSGETLWGNPKATQTTFTKVKAAGFNTVRIPVTWLGHIGEAPEYRIEDAWLDRVAEVVGYAEAAGLNAIINMHHDGADSKFWLDIKGAATNPAVHQQILEQVSAMWGQIADRFKDKGDFLIFEAFNEIHDGGWGWGANRNDGGKQYKCLNEWNQAFVDAVRAAGGENEDRILGIPAYCTNVDISLESFVMPEDTAKDRLMMAVHCYDPYDYTLAAKKSEWGHTAESSKKVSGDNESDLRKVFEKIYKNYISKGIPVYMGEFGCVNRATAREQAFQQYYLKYYAKLSKTYGVPSIIWDNGAKGAGEERHAFINHGTGAYCSTEAKAAIEALISSYTNSFTLEDVYNNAPKN